MSEKSKGNTLPNKGSIPHVRRYRMADNTYRYPPVSLLKRTRGMMCLDTPEEIEQRAAAIQGVLDDSDYPGRVIDYIPEPLTTTFVVEYDWTRGGSTKLLAGFSKLKAKLSSTFGLAVSVIDINDKICISNFLTNRQGYIGIVVPNLRPQRLLFGDVVFSSVKGFQGDFTIGVDAFGNDATTALSGSPLFLCEGEARKALLDSIIMSCLLKSAPELLGLVLMDFGSGELERYEGIPHLVAPVVRNPDAALAVLCRVVAEIERRLTWLHPAYPHEAPQKDERYSLPYLAVVVNGLEALLEKGGEEATLAIRRISQMGKKANVVLVACVSDTALERIPCDIYESWRGLLHAYKTPRESEFEITATDDSWWDTVYVGAHWGSLRGRAVKIIPPAEDEVSSVVAFASSQSEPELQRRFLPEGEEPAALLEAFKCWDAEDPLLAGAAINALGKSETPRSRLVPESISLMDSARSDRIVDFLVSRGVIAPHPQGVIAPHPKIRRDQFLIQIESFEELLELAGR